RHGQDVMLTLTCDCAIDDEHIRKIARSLRTYGRMMLRLNHECNGNWFTHNRRFSYEEVAAFFVRVCKIVKQEAPNVRMVFCAGLIKDKPDPDGIYRVEYEDVFAEAYRCADVWSADKYLALHFGWPYDVAEPGGRSYTCDDPAELFARYEKTYKRLSELFGERPFIQAELNADGDVTGPLRQAGPVLAYYGLVRDKKASWLTGISMYQFRDRGRLGLEVQDVNNPAVGNPVPLMKEYRKILEDPYFMPEIADEGKTSYPARLRWGGSEDADGIGMMLSFEKTPEFCEVTLPEELSLMMEFHGKWFYKAPGVSVIDLMSAFFDRPLEGPARIMLRIFATVPDGENHDDNSNTWMTDQFFDIEEEPQLRIRYVTPAEQSPCPDRE
ncbi:MAG: hypothetical protein IKQ40_05260, partial [Lachnospiraceae bacterium]|nr:hypothetical protein [Lachnospiraceae bacterium]